MDSSAQGSPFPPADSCQRESVDLAAVLPLPQSSAREVQGDASLASDVVSTWKAYLEKQLWRWKTFDLALAPSVIDELSDVIGSDYVPWLVPPDVDSDLDASGRDSAGNLRKLSREQLSTVRRDGRFFVDSSTFPGLKHQWELNAFLQYGTANLFALFRHRMVIPVRVLIDWIPFAVGKGGIEKGSFFSLYRSVFEICYSLYELLDSFIGMRSMSSVQRHNYAVSRDSIWTDLWAIYSAAHARELPLRQCRKDFNFRAAVFEIALGAQSNIVVDGRMYLSTLTKFQEELNRCFDEVSEQWKLEKVAFQQAKWEQLKGTPNAAVAVYEATVREQNRRFLEKVTAFLERLPPDVPRCGSLSAEEDAQLFKDTVLGLYILSEIVASECDALSSDVQAFRVSTEDQLRREHTVRGCIDSWLHERLDARVKAFTRERENACNDNIMRRLQSDAYLQRFYSLAVSYCEFSAQCEVAAQKYVDTLLQPTRTVSFRRQLWRKSQYHVSIHHRESSQLPVGLSFQGRHNVIRPWYDDVGREVVASAVDDYTSARSLSVSQDAISEATVPLFHVVAQYDDYDVSSSFPFWRWWALLVCCWVWWSNVTHFFTVGVLWDSCFGVRALLWPRRFCPSSRSQLDSDTGDFKPSAFRDSPTVWSSFKTLWQSIFRSRNEFERRPDTGLLGKSVSRIFNVIWNYVFVGLFGSLIILIVWPLACFVVMLLSICVIFTSIFWVPIITLLAASIRLLVFDWHGRPFPNHLLTTRFVPVLASVFRMIWYVVVLLSCLAFIVVICPVVIVIVLLWSVAALIARLIWEFFVFHLVLKARARVPISNTFVARRIAGPGISSQLFMEVAADVPLMQVRLCLELAHLSAMQAYYQYWTEAPLAVCRDAVHSMAKLMSISAGPASDLTNMISLPRIHADTFFNSIRLRQEALSSLRAKYRGKDVYRMRRRNVELFSTLGSELVQNYTEQYIFPFIDKNSFWEQHQLALGDWNGLFSQYTQEAGLYHILDPLEDIDNALHLQISHVSVSKIWKALRQGVLIPDDLETARVDRAPFFSASAPDNSRVVLLRPERFLSPWAVIPETARLRRAIVFPPNSFDFGEFRAVNITVTSRQQGLASVLEQVALQRPYSFAGVAPLLAAAFTDLYKTGPAKFNVIVAPLAREHYLPASPSPRSAATQEDLVLVQ